MRKTFSTTLSILVIVATLSACGAPSGGPGGMPPGGASDNLGGRNAGGCKTLVEQIGEQLAATEQALVLAPKQLVLWERYRDGVSALMADQLRLEPYQGAHRSALQQIDGRVDIVRNRLTAMEDVAERAATLYRALDEAQKKVADQRLAATIPALYSGSSCQGASEDAGGKGNRGAGRGGPGGGMGGAGGGAGRF